ncbi:RNA polymerase sigma-70 factor [Snuella lapsa]|uniref:RNA polymerase sigma-70 factor n=1 Tax=Snuella lapsa TaxID=870481 RepID=A0ABP6WMS4_9FLAO
MKKHFLHKDENQNLINSKTFRVVYLNHWDKLYVYAFNILKDKKICEDLVQDIFFTLWKNRNTTNIHNISGYLFQSLKFKIYKHFRDTKFIDMDIEKFHNIKETSESPYDMITLQDLERIVAIHSEKLPKRCQEIFYLSRFECLSHKEIADKLNISIRTVKNQISVALKHLKVHLEKESYVVLLLFLYLLVY